VELLVTISISEAHKLHKINEAGHDGRLNAELRPEGREFESLQARHGKQRSYPPQPRPPRETERETVREGSSGLVPPVSAARVLSGHTPNACGQVGNTAAAPVVGPIAAAPRAAPRPPPAVGLVAGLGGQAAPGPPACRLGRGSPARRPVRPALLGAGGAHSPDQPAAPAAQKAGAPQRG